MKKAIAGLVLMLTFAAGFAARDLFPAAQVVSAQGPRVFELRTYVVPDSAKLDLLHARFRNHTGKFFQRHGMTQVWYGKPMDQPASGTTMIYMLGTPAAKPRRRAGMRFARTRNGRPWRRNRAWAR